jgi:hypothetical protein
MTSRPSFQGGVYIANSNGLRGDVVRSGADEQTMVVRLRGSGAEIPVDESDLVEFSSTASASEAEDESTGPSVTADDSVILQQEERRRCLYEKNEENGDFYLGERILALELGDEFSFQLVSNSKDKDSLPLEVEGNVLIRLVEAYYINQGDVVAHGRHLTSFHKTLYPFYKEEEVGNSIFSKVPGESFSEIFENTKAIFANGGAEKALLYFRAFCYAQHRLDYSPSKEDSLLDAFVVCFFVIQLLQGKIQDVNLEAGSIHAIIDDEFFNRKTHDDIDLTGEDLLWCFCNLFLKICIDIRRRNGSTNYNQLLTAPFSVTIKEELMVARLCIDLRPESPMAFLSAYRMVLDTKRCLPQGMQEGWLQSAYEYAMKGLMKADAWGDPFFQYVFYVIDAFWLPTSMQSPTPYSFGEIKSRIRLAHEFKEECEGFCPKEQFWIAELHEALIQKILKNFPFDDEMEITFPLMDCRTFAPIRHSK